MILNRSNKSGFVLRFLSDRQFDKKRRSVPLLAFHRDRPTVGRHQLAGNGQSLPTAGYGDDGPNMKLGDCDDDPGF